MLENEPPRTNPYSLLIIDPLNKTFREFPMPAPITKVKEVLNTPERTIIGQDITIKPKDDYPSSTLFPFFPK